MKNEFNKINEVLMTNNFSCNGPTKQDNEYIIEAGQYTPAGEDWYICLWYDGTYSDFTQQLAKYVNSFDVDEETELWIDSRGKNGVPDSISELINDAKWKLKTLKTLLKNFERKARIMEKGIYITVENYKGGTNNLWVVFDKYGIKGTSTKDRATAYKNYLRNRTKRYQAEYRRAKRENKQAQPTVKASYL